MYLLIIFCNISCNSRIFLNYSYVYKKSLIIVESIQISIIQCISELLKSNLKVKLFILNKYKYFK